MNQGKAKVAEKAYIFGVTVVKTMRKYMLETHEFDLSRQLIRSGAGVGAILRDAEFAETTKDFIHKLSLARKEANEARYWLGILVDSELLDSQIAAPLIKESAEIVKMLTSSIKTLKAKMPTQMPPKRTAPLVTSN
jgi:four helix bundle protein